MLCAKNQIDDINCVLRKHALFDEAYQNNFSLVVSNRTYNKEKYGGNNGELFFGLNKANLNLQKLIGICLEEIEKDMAYDDVAIRELRKVHDVWSQFTKKGNQFLTYDPAEALIKGFELIRFPFYDRLDEKIVVKNAFVDLVPEEVKSMIRICLIIPDDQVMRFLDQFLCMVSDNRQYYYFIDRIEIAKSGFFRVNDDVFPTFNININPYFLTNVRHPVIDEMLHTIKLLAGDSPSKGDVYPYYKEIWKNVLLCQGFKNYKKFLVLVKAIDRVYDIETDFAFRLV